MSSHKNLKREAKPKRVADIRAYMSKSKRSPYGLPSGHRFSVGEEHRRDHEDSERNAVGVANTSNVYFGSKVMSPSTGLLMNNVMKSGGAGHQKLVVGGGHQECGGRPAAALSAQSGPMPSVALQPMDTSEGFSGQQLAPNEKREECEVMDTTNSGLRLPEMGSCGRLINVFYNFRRGKKRRADEAGLGIPGLATPKRPRLTKAHISSDQMPGSAFPIFMNELLL